ncbi:MAG: DUF1223 domain-containing protein [Bauldia sp.]|uniref:DUF1223 domain-containing protein n=1 Tax=Bauldia sp. TaxID=2575872 RepID=UPI001DD0259A|nr:DUF1223 domain-containing protein [Bauldia sp.]MCB1497176.1 DUF1223 domain-containing protein [Bauldia sp.]
MSTATKTIAALVFGTGLAAGTVSALAETKAVVELFTSQGCSSCPPADALIADYAKRDDVLALSYPVDYWDYLGWKDTLANHENTERQRSYAAARGDRQVYTPQVVVNGREHMVGSNRSAIDGAIDRLAGSLSVPITLTAGSDTTKVTIGSANVGTPDKGMIWLAMYDDPVTVPIARGENSGRSITYTNVVRKLRPIAMWKGEEMTVELPKSELMHADVSRCAVILQTELPDGLPGPILGAAAIDYEN